MSKTTVAVMRDGVIDYGNGDTIDMRDVDELYQSARLALKQITSAAVASVKPLGVLENDFCGAGW